MKVGKGGGGKAAAARKPKQAPPAAKGGGGGGGGGGPQDKAKMSGEGAAKASDDTNQLYSKMREMAEKAREKQSAAMDKLLQA